MVFWIRMRWTPSSTRWWPWRSILAGRRRSSDRWDLFLSSCHLWLTTRPAVDRPLFQKLANIHSVNVICQIHMSSFWELFEVLVYKGLELSNYLGYWRRFRSNVSDPVKHDERDRLWQWRHSVSPGVDKRRPHNHPPSRPAGAWTGQNSSS